MPNIEIHGCVTVKGPDVNVTSFDFSEAFEVKHRVDQVMQQIGLGDDAVTTIIPSLVVTCDGSHKVSPYLRVCSTKSEQTKFVAEALEKAGLGIDIETLTIDDFIKAG